MLIGMVNILCMSHQNSGENSQEGKCRIARKGRLLLLLIMLLIYIYPRMTRNEKIHFNFLMLGRYGK